MTEEEKKEFEEFLQWKKERAAQAKDNKENSVISQNQESNEKKETGMVPNDNKEDVSDKETSPSSDNSSSWAIFAFAAVIIAIFVIFFTAITIDKKYNRDKSLSQLVSETQDYNETVEADTIADIRTSKPESPKNTWEIRTEKDEMTDTKNIWAEIKSEDFICQDFPYDGLTYAFITVRYMKKYGYDVLIQISQGQIDGRSYYRTDYITARFDEGAPKRYYFNEAADGSSDVVFLRNKSDFIKKCKQAKNIKIDIPIYQSGRPVFTFHVDEPLVWPKE